MSSYAIYGWIGVFFSLLFLVWFFITLFRLQRSVPPDKEGWIVMRPSLLFSFLGLSAFLLACVWIILALAMLFLVGLYSLQGAGIAFLFLVMSVVFFRFALGDVAMVIRFNNDSIKIKRLGREAVIFWDYVERIGMNYFSGPMIYSQEGDFSVSNLRQGFPQFVETALSHGVDVDDTLLK